ncbi:MAG: hypothetical protein ACOC7O_02880, partial [Thermoplasmatota archaeon]
LDLRKYVIEDPERTFPMIEEVFSNWEYSGYDNFHFAIKDLPDRCKRKVRELREEDIGKYVGVKGIIRRTSEIIPFPEVIYFECSRCNERTRKTQNKNNYNLEEPLECVSCGKGPNKTNFEPIMNDIEWKDFQEVRITERERDMKGGEQPRSKKAIIWDPLEGQVTSSDEVILNCIYKAKFKKNSSIPETFLEVKSIEFVNKDFEEIKLSEEEEERIQELSKEPNIFDKIVKSINPSIKGLRKVKESITLQLFGGTRKNLNENNFRGDIHILLAGDPETGKSQLLDYVSKIAPKGILGSGKGASGVGLTASVTQEEIAGETHWVLDPGVLPLADGGLACIDEFDKMRGEDRDTIHRAIEQQSFPVHKANIHQTLNSRCPVLAAANPKYGRFDLSDINNPEKKLIEEIDIKHDLRSRFDYIWIITRDRNKDEHKELASHISKLHSELSKKINDPNYEIEKDFNPPLDQEELRNYIIKAKEIKPIWKEGPRKKIDQFYTHLAEKMDFIGPRTHESLIRSAEASARLHFRKEVTMEDVNRAIDLKEEQLNSIGNLEKLYTGYSKTEKTLLKEVRDLIRELREEHPEGVPKENILNAAERDNFDRSEVEKELDRMRTNGQVYTPTKGRYKLCQGV